MQSELGKGSNFTVYLRAQIEGTDAPASIDLRAGEPPRGAGEMILVVDDEAFIRDITKQTLENFGYQVLVAEDGADAITRFIQNQSKIALVLTDLVMPVMDGLALVAALRRIAPLVRIIGASGASEEDDVVRFSDAGVDHVIAKPFSAYTLLCALRDALKRP